MRIYGDDPSSQFKTHTQEPGLFWGHDDVLVGEKGTFRRITISFFGNTDKRVTVQPKLYLHFSNSLWSSFTGALREYFLPWQWEAIYIDHENGSSPQRALACTSVYDGELSDRLKEIMGRALLVVELIMTEHYEKIFDWEYLSIPRYEGLHDIEIAHPLGKTVGCLLATNVSYNLCPIYRVEGIFSRIQYLFMQTFFSSWEEVTLTVNSYSEKVLIKKDDRDQITKTGFIKPS